MLQNDKYISLYILTLRDEILTGEPEIPICKMSQEHGFFWMVDQNTKSELGFLIRSRRLFTLTAAL